MYKLHRSIIVLSVIGLGVVLVALTILLTTSNNQVIDRSVTPKSMLVNIPLVDETQTTPVVPTSTQPVSLIFFGDIMMGRNVEVYTAKKGQEYPFEKVKNLIQSSDIAIANLEGPIMAKHVVTLTGSTTFNFLPITTKTITGVGFDIVSLANNHTLDFGQQGFDETRQLLTAASIASIGHPETLHTDYIVRKEVKGHNFIFVGLNTVPNKYTDDKLEFVRKLSQQYNTTVVIFMHWGEEYQLHSNTKQQEFAHKLIDSGADILIGAHPHVVQEIELYRDKPIFYSLGNFIFDQYFSKDTQQELGLGIVINGGQATYTLYPLQSAQSQPIEMQGVDREKFLKSLADRSDKTLQDQIMNGVITEPFTTN